MTTPPPSLLQRLRDRLPELILQTVSVVLAVLLALAVDRWQEERANRQLAGKARATLLSEARANLAELETRTAQHDALLQQLDQDARRLGSAPGAEGEVGIDFSLVLLSSAAWQTAQVTRASHFIEYDWIIEASRLYDLQALYHASQAGFLEHVTRFPEAAEGDPARAVAALRDRLGVLVGLGRNLVGAYRQFVEDEPEGVAAAEARDPQETARGRLRTDTVPAPALAGSRIGEPPRRAALVHLPERYDTDGDARFPVVVLLHAFGSGPESWLGDGGGYEGMDVTAVLDSLVAAGGARPAILVMPDGGNRSGGSWYVDSPSTGDWARFLAVDLLRFLSESPGAPPSR